MSPISTQVEQSNNTQHPQDEAVVKAIPVRILMVDDTPANLFTLTQVLEPLGHELLQANSGPAALRVLLEQDVAVILLDVQMPGMDGFEVAKMIRARARSRYTPILFLTAFYKQDAQVEKGYALGAVDYLFKPFDPTILCAKVSVLVELYQQRELICQQTETVYRLKAQLLEQKMTQALLEQERVATEKITQKSEALARSNAELEQFAYIASHDLREPLRIIASYTQLLAERYQGELDARADKYIHYIVDGSQRMQQMIDALLELSRVGRGELALVSSDCTKIVTQVLQVLQPQMDATRAVVRYEGLPQVFAAPLLLAQVFQNLIANAIKFKGESPPEVVISASENTQQEEWLFRVQDNGIGFDPQFAERIFSLFQRLHQREEYPGSGIGLSLVKKIIERHDGHIWAESEQGQGATFYFTLPIKALSADVP